MNYAISFHGYDLHSITRPPPEIRFEGIMVSQVQAAVVRYFGLRMSDMTTARRDKIISRPRQIAMYLARELTPRSLPDIGRRFARDHTTVIYAIQVIEKLMATDPELARDVEIIRNRLEAA